MHPSLRASGKKLDIKSWLFPYICVLKTMFFQFLPVIQEVALKMKILKMNTDYGPRGDVRFGPCADRC